LDSPNFKDTLHEALVAIYITGHFALHFPMLFPILDSLPDWLVLKAEPALLPVVGLRKVNLQHFFPYFHIKLLLISEIIGFGARGRRD
jgi:hypothetical protein